MSEYTICPNAANHPEDADDDMLKYGCEYGIHDNTLLVDFGATCSACGFSFFFKHEVYDVLAAGAIDESIIRE